MSRSKIKYTIFFYKKKKYKFFVATDCVCLIFPNGEKKLISIKEFIHKKKKETKNILKQCGKITVTKEDVLDFLKKDDKHFHLKMRIDDCEWIKFKDIFPDINSVNAKIKEIKSLNLNVEYSFVTIECESKH